MSNGTPDPDRIITQAERDQATVQHNKEAMRTRNQRRGERMPVRPPLAEPGALAGVAITTPTATEIALTAHQALRAFVSVLSGDYATGPVWEDLPLEEKQARVKNVQRIAVGDTSGGWASEPPGVKRRDQVYSLIVMGILAIGEDEFTGSVRPRFVDLASRVLGWLGDGETMQVQPLLGPILKVLAEHVNGDDDGAVGTAKRLSTLAYDNSHSLLLKVIEPHRNMAPPHDPELPHEAMSRIIGELALTENKRANLEAVLTQSQADRDQMAAEHRAVSLAFKSLPHAVRDRLDATQPYAEQVRKLGDLAMDGVRNIERAKVAMDAQAALEHAMHEAPITVGANTVLASSPLLVERIKLMAKMLFVASDALSKERATHENYRSKALAWEDLILWVARDVPQPWSALVDAHGDDPERWRKWPDQVRRLVRAIIDEERRQREAAVTAQEELDEHEAKDEAGYGSDAAYPDEALLLATLRSAGARLAGIDDGMVKTINAVVSLAEGEHVVEQEDDEDEAEEA